jgi:hypothetical protein
MPTAIRRSSWERTPTEITLGVRGIDALNLLSRYSVLTTWHFPALLGGNSHNWQERLRLLFDGGFVERPVQLKRHFNAMNRPRGYKATPQGLRAVGKSAADLPRGSGSPPHDLMASDLMASFEIGAKENGIRFITWQELLNSKSMPEATRNLPKPWAIPVPYQGKTYSVEADAEPFGLQITRNGRNIYYFCLIEADMNTMGLESATFERSSIVKKFTLYLECERLGLFKQHFGVNMVVPFFTIDHGHRKKMQSLLDKISGGTGSKIILFGGVYPPFEAKNIPKPSGRALHMTYERVGYDPFRFLPE